MTIVHTKEALVNAHSLILCSLLALALSCPAAAAEARKISQVDVRASEIGKNWERTTNTVIIDDVDDLQSIPAEKRAAAGNIAADFKKHKIRSGGDITFKKQGDGGILINKIFIFASKAACDQWVQEKKMTDWKDFTRKEESPPFHYENAARGEVALVDDDTVIISRCIMLYSQDDRYELAKKANAAIAKDLK
jgi:hypothetical protein